MLDKGQLIEATRSERELAWRVLSREVAEDQTPERLAAATVTAFDQLCSHLILLIGSGGFEALVKRSIFLAKGEYPYLGGVAAVTDNETFQLRGLDASVQGRDVAEVRAGLTLLLGAFFWLLVTFVGKSLFWQLLRGVWSDINPVEPGFNGEEMR